MSSLQRIKARLGTYTPIMTAAITLGAAAWLYFQDDRRGAIVGFAQTVPESVAALEMGKVQSVLVTVGQEVLAGQVIATLDTASIDLDLMVAKAEKKRIEAAVAVEQAMLEHRIELELQALQREQFRHKEEQQRASAEAKELSEEIGRVKRLVEDRQAVMGDLTKLDLQQAAVSAVVSEKPKTLGLINKQIEATEQRKQQFRAQSSALAKKLEADLQVASQQIELLEKRRANLTLRATNAGRVSAIVKQPGEVIKAGDAIVNLVGARSKIIACLPERVALGAQEGDPAKMFLKGRTSDPISGKISAMGPMVAELPSRCWLSPSVPVWGREIAVTLDVPMNLVPGQAFDVVIIPLLAGQESRHQETGTVFPLGGPAVSSTLSSAGAASVGSAKDTGSISSVANGGKGAPKNNVIKLMTVPDSLMKLTRFEPSGALYQPERSRYLLVSDDTGYKHNEGTPWLFSMSATGQVDDKPIEITGVDSVDDLEAIAQGDAGEIYLLSSQSVSKKGKRKRARTALLRGRWDGDSLKIDGEIHLAEALDANAELATKLGLVNGTTALDIEGLTSRDGSLYFGLKAPLDQNGRAMIWRVSKPSALFERREDSSDYGAKKSGNASRLVDSQCSLWATVGVDVTLAGNVVPGGISDLMFLKDGTLIVSSTPSVAEGEAGALWKVKASAERNKDVILLRRFESEKPEGLASTSNPSELMVVFDKGAATPAFVQVPIEP